MQRWYQKIEEKLLQLALCYGIKPLSVQRATEGQIFYYKHFTIVSMYLCLFLFSILLLIMDKCTRLNYVDGNRFKLRRN